MIAEKRTCDACVEVVVQTRESLQCGDALSVFASTDGYRVGGSDGNCLHLSSELGLVALELNETRPTQRSLEAFEDEVRSLDPELLLADVQVAPMPARGR